MQQEQRSSGLTVREYCQMQSISYNSFNYWRSKYGTISTIIKLKRCSLIGLQRLLYVPTRCTLPYGHENSVQMLQGSNDLGGILCFHSLW